MFGEEHGLLDCWWSAEGEEMHLSSQEGREHVNGLSYSPTGGWLVKIFKEMLLRHKKWRPPNEVGEEEVLSIKPFPGLSLSL